MIKIITGQAGEGKTKWLIDVANEKVQWGGQKVTIGDALNPGFYDEENTEI